MRCHTGLDPSSLAATTARANNLLITRVLEQVDEIAHRAGTIQPRSYDCLCEHLATLDGLSRCLTILRSLEEHAPYLHWIRKFVLSRLFQAPDLGTPDLTTLTSV